MEPSPREGPSRSSCSASSRARKSNSLFFLVKEPGGSALITGLIHWFLRARAEPKLITSRRHSIKDGQDETTNPGDFTCYCHIRIYYRRLHHYQPSPRPLPRKFHLGLHDQILLYHGHTFIHNPLFSKDSIRPRIFHEGENHYRPFCQDEETQRVRAKPDHILVTQTYTGGRPMPYCWGEADRVPGIWRRFRLLVTTYPIQPIHTG